jgi:putative ABC transport system ATP-binding protein
MSKKTIIETIDVAKIYGIGDISVAALNGVSIKIETGEFVAIMGPSGSGKSTLLHILGCLSHPTLGQYILDGEDVSQMDKNQLAVVRNRKLGFVFQAYNLLPRTTTLRNTILPLQYDRQNTRTPEENLQKGSEVLDLVGLGDRMNHQPQELSGGQQQRASIARALVNEPVVIIADEPTGNLDSRSGKEIMHLLTTLNKKGTTIVMVTHDPAIAAFTQRTIHLRDGMIETIVNNGDNKIATDSEKVLS